MSRRAASNEQRKAAKGYWGSPSEEERHPRSQTACLRTKSKALEMSDCTSAAYNCANRWLAARMAARHSDTPSDPPGLLRKRLPQTAEAAVFPGAKKWAARPHEHAEKRDIVPDDPGLGLPRYGAKL